MKLIDNTHDTSITFFSTNCDNGVVRITTEIDFYVSEEKYKDDRGGITLPTDSFQNVLDIVQHFYTFVDEERMESFPIGVLGEGPGMDKIECTLPLEEMPR